MKIYSKIRGKLFRLPRSGKVTSLEIRENKVRIIQLKKKSSGIELSKLIRFSSEEKFPNLVEVFKSNQIEVSKLITSIPRHLVTQRYLTIPSSNPSEIQDMLKYQLQGLVPYSKEEIIFDYSIIDKDEKGYSKIMLIIAYQEIVNKHLSFFSKMGIEPDIIQLSSAALANWHLSLKEKADSQEMVALLDIEENSLDLTIVTGRKMVFSRGVSLKKEKTSYPQIILEEINRSLISLAKETDKKINRMILVGGNDSLDDLASYLEKNLDIPFQIAKPLTDIALSKSLAEKEEDIRRDASLVKLLGLSLGEISPISISLNFLPFPIQKKRKVQAKRKTILKQGVLSFAIVLLLIANFSYKIHKRDKDISLLKERIKKIKPVALQVQNRRRKLEVIRKELNLGVPSLDLLSELYQISPGSIVLNMFAMETGKVIILRGQAQRLSQVFEYVTTLEKSSYLENIKVKYAGKRRIGTKELVNFELYCSLSPLSKKR